MVMHFEAALPQMVSAIIYLEHLFSTVSHPTPSPNGVGSRATFSLSKNWKYLNFGVFFIWFIFNVENMTEIHFCWGELLWTLMPANGGIMVQGNV